MAMHTTDNAEHDDFMLDINTTPLIDVMLVLLVMLILTIPLQLHGVQVQLPGGATPPPSTPPQVVHLTIAANNQILWNDEPVRTPEALQERLTLAASQAEQPELHIRADNQSAYDSLAKVLVAAQQARLTKIGIVGTEQLLP